MVQFRHGIEQLLPKFRSLVFLLKSEPPLLSINGRRESETLPTKAQLEDAQKTRKRLLDLFTQYDTVSKRLLTLPSPTPTDERVQKAMNQAATHFLQTHMLPLQSLPKILGKGRSPLAKENAPQENGRGVSAAEEKVLKEKMMVLEEQKFLVENMIEQARRGRRMEEVAALRESVGELEGEIDKIKQELGDLHIE
jgi:rabenosyn-5